MPSPPPTTGSRQRIAGVNRNVFLLGVVSFLADTAGELIYPLIPIFITVTLGAPASVLGLIEGVAEGLASLLRVVSGWLADRLGRSKPLVALGYGLAALAKPLLALAPTWLFALVARALDRTGKGCVARHATH
jgi:MFS family permease